MIDLGKIIRHGINYIQVKNQLKTPLTLIHFITNDCNMKCEHCFYWKSINTVEKELTLEEIERVVSSLKQPLESVILTGGEPFLNKGLQKICEIYFKKNNVKNICIMTNGLFVDNIFNKTVDILENVNTNVSICVSLDNLGEKHDKIRGVNGAFNSATKTIKKLKKLGEKHKNLKVNALTVVSNYNYMDLDEISSYILQNLCIDHSFELARGTCQIKNKIDILNKNSPKGDEWMLPESELDDIYLRIKDSYKRQNRRAGTPLILSPFVLSLAQTQFAVEMLKDKRQIVECLAGNVVGVIYPNGDVSVCEFFIPGGNLREYGLDFHRLWHSGEMNVLRKRTKDCFCSHGCFLQPSIGYNLKACLRFVLNDLSK